MTRESPFAETRNTPRLELVRVPCPVCGCARHRTVAGGADYEYATCSNAFFFVQCRDCGAVYLNPRPSPKDFNIIYPANYYSFDPAGAAEKRNALVQGVWDLLERKRLDLFRGLLGEGPRRLLDMGCGTGRMLMLLRRYGAPDWSLTGVEFGIADCFLKRTDGIKIYKGLYEEVEFEEAPFDLIIAQQVVEHAFDPALLLQKTHRDLAPGGHAVFDTPDYDSIDRRLFSRRYWGGYHFPRHMTLFTAASFARLAASRGFEVVSCRKMLSPVFWVHSLHNVLLGAGFPEQWARRVHYQSLPLISLATIIEAANLSLFRRNSNMRIILRKPRSET